MLNSLKDESLFTSLVSRQGATPSRDSRFAITKSPREEYIKKRVVSQLTQKNRNNASSISKTSPRNIVSPDAQRYNMKKKQDETDYISLNRRVSLLSRDMGKAATMGSTAARNHSNAMYRNSCPLTSLKESQEE